MQLSKLKDNKSFLIAVLLISIIGLAYIGVNVFMASFVGDTTTYAYGHIKLSEYKQDGSRNMQVVSGESHDLEFWIDPFGSGSLYEYMFMYNWNNKAEQYRVTIYPADYSPGYFTIHIPTVNTLGPWGLEYWERGSNRASETYMMMYSDDSPFTLIEYNITQENDYCEGTTRYDNATFFMGDVFFDEHINSVECGYINPCEGVICDNYCNGTTFYGDGTCVNGECIYDVEILNSVDECDYVAPTPTPDPTEEPTESPTEEGTPDSNATEAPTEEPTEEPSLIDNIIDLFGGSESTDEPDSSSSGSSSSDDSSTVPAPEEDEIIAEPEDKTVLDDFLEWLKELVNNITGV